MSILCDTVSPEDVITCDILIGSRAFTTSGLYQAWGEASEMIGVKIIGSLGLLSAVTAATLVWSFCLHIYTPPAFLAGFLFPVFLISLFC